MKIKLSFGKQAVNSSIPEKMEFKMKDKEFINIISQHPSFEEFFEVMTAKAVLESAGAIKPRYHKVPKPDFAALHESYKQLHPDQVFNEGHSHGSVMFNGTLKTNKAENPITFGGKFNRTADISGADRTPSWAVNKEQQVDTNSTPFPILPCIGEDQQDCASPEIVLKELDDIGIKSFILDLDVESLVKNTGAESFFVSTNVAGIIEESSGNFVTLVRLTYGWLPIENGFNLSDRKAVLDKLASSKIFTTHEDLIEYIKGCNTSINSALQNESVNNLQEETVTTDTTDSVYTQTFNSGEFPNLGTLIDPVLELNRNSIVRDELLFAGVLIISPYPHKNIFDKDSFYNNKMANTDIMGEVGDYVFVRFTNVWVMLNKSSLDKLTMPPRLIGFLNLCTIISTPTELRAAVRKAASE